jgi:hypothetical protein
MIQAARTRWAMPCERRRRRTTAAAQQRRCCIIVACTSSTNAPPPRAHDACAHHGTSGVHAYKLRMPQQRHTRSAAPADMARGR